MKGEIVHDEQFFLLSQYFHILSAANASKVQNSSASGKGRVKYKMSHVTQKSTFGASATSVNQFILYDLVN